MAHGDELTNDEAALVFRRAAELDDLERARRHLTAPGALTPDVVEQIAREAGLSTASVRRALAEFRAGTLTSEAPVEGRASIGPETVVVERMIPLGAGEATHEVDRFLRKQLFTVLRNFGDRRIWEPRSGLWASVTRSIDFSNRLTLTSVSQITSAVANEPGGNACCVRFEARLTNVRRGYRVLAASGAVVGAGGAAAALALVGDPLALLSVPAAAGVAGGTWAGARAGYRWTATRTALALERFLDTLEHGEVHTRR